MDTLQKCLLAGTSPVQLVRFATDYLKEAGFEEVRVYRDLAGSDRVTVGYIRRPSQGEDNV